jgi:hypothetical protein
MVTLRTRHFPKIGLGVVTKSTLLELRKSAGNPLRLWLDQCAKSTVGVALASENLLESVDVQKRKQKAFSGKIVVGD